MVQELLTISRLDTPGYICKKSYLNLSNLIIDRVTAFEDLFMQKDLTVENTGAHIPDEAIPKLFEPFYRVDQSRNRQTGGTGLGLYIVKTIFDLHGAKIEIANTIQGVIVSIQF